MMVGHGAAAKRRHARIDLVDGRRQRREHRLLGLRRPHEDREAVGRILRKRHVHRRTASASSGPSLMSSTMPTISIGGCDAFEAYSSCLPIGFSPGKYCLTIAWLMMMTGGFDGRSSPVK